MISGEYGNIEESVRSLGRLFSPPGSSSRPLWGLFFFEEKGDLHFIHFHQENWFTRIVGEKDSSVPVGDEEVHLIFRKEERLSVRQMNASGFLKRIFRPFPLFHLVMEGTPEETIIFELDDPGQEFLRMLGDS